VSSHAARMTRRPSRARTRRRRLRLLAAVALVGVIAAVAIVEAGRIGDAVREITLPLRHDDIIRQQAAEKGLDPSLIAAVIYAESRFRDQESQAGALGLMQITPQTAHLIARLSGGTQFVTGDLSDPDINIRYGAYYLHYLMRRYHGNEVAALAAYNAGIHAVDRWGGSELDLDAIGFPETRAYVEEVFDKRQEYRKKYPDELAIR
jgi:soluble lytic murein transglycosylase